MCLRHMIIIKIDKFIGTWETWFLLVDPLLYISIHNEQNLSTTDFFQNILFTHFQILGVKYNIHAKGPIPEGRLDLG